MVGRGGELATDVKAVLNREVESGCRADVAELEADGDGQGKYRPLFERGTAGGHPSALL